MCQMSRPEPGRPASYPVRCRFSTRKYSEPCCPSRHRRWTVRPALTSSNVIDPVSVTLTSVAQPCWSLHQADGWDGTSPPPFQELPPMRHQLPTPSELSSMS